MFEINSHCYLAYADRLTGYIELAHYPRAPVSSTIIDTFRNFFHRWGVAEELSIDGGPNISSKEIRSWLSSWGVKYRLSSAYYPQSNGRAESAVKSMKRLLANNTGPRGSLDTDDVARALLMYRNTPLRDIQQSPAELALGRQLRDSIPVHQKRYNVNPQWAYNLRQREIVMSKHNVEAKDKYDVNAKSHEALQVGDRVLCQNTRNNKWDKSAIIIDTLPHRQYTVKMDGSGRLSLRNRKHLCKILITKPVTPYIPMKPQVKTETSAPETIATEHLSTPESTIPSITPSVDECLPPSPPQLLRRSSRKRQPPARFRE